MQHDKPSRDDLTIRQAAELAGRSYSWARDRVMQGALECRVGPNGRTLVTVSSVRAAIARDHARSAPPLQRGGHLRLVVDNS